LETSERRITIGWLLRLVTRPDGQKIVLTPRGSDLTKVTGGQVVALITKVAVSMEIPMGIPMGMGMGWVWKLW